MHLRKLPAFPAPSRLMQLVAKFDEADIDNSRSHAEALCERHRGQPPAAGKYFISKIGNLDFVWEQHTEVATYTFIAPGAGDGRFDMNIFGSVGLDCLRTLPTKVIRATQIALESPDASKKKLEQLQAVFKTEDLIVCDVAGGRTRIWSDFRLQEDGFGRLLVLDQGLRGYEPAQLIQRLQELGNYRNMALLGLPVAQTLTPEVTRLEQRLAELAASLAEPAARDEVLLEELGFLSAEQFVAKSRLAELSFADARGHGAGKAESRSTRLHGPSDPAPA